MKRSFVRGLWGIYDNDRRYYKRRAKMDDDIKFLKHLKYSQPFVTYVFGKENYKFLVDQGFECKLIDDKPILWDMDTEQFRHKLEIFNAAMEDYDEIVFLDWDTVPIKQLPLDFWEVLGQKDDFQAILRMYHRTKAQWRKGDRRKIPCASFVYICNKDVPKDLIREWEENRRPWSEEVIMARYTDKRVGGWKGIDTYWDHFEPDFFILNEGRVYDRQKLATKNHCFSHINMKTRMRIGRTRSHNKPSWVK